MFPFLAFKACKDAAMRFDSDAVKSVKDTQFSESAEFVDTLDRFDDDDDEEFVEGRKPKPADKPRKLAPDAEQDLTEKKIEKEMPFEKDEEVIDISKPDIARSVPESKPYLGNDVKLYERPSGEISARDDYGFDFSVETDEAVKKRQEDLEESDFEFDVTVGTVETKTAQPKPKRFTIDVDVAVEEVPVAETVNQDIEAVTAELETVAEPKKAQVEEKKKLVAGDKEIEEGDAERKIVPKVLDETEKQPSLLLDSKTVPLDTETAVSCNVEESHKLSEPEQRVDTDFDVDLEDTDNDTADSVDTVVDLTDKTADERQKTEKGKAYIGASAMHHMTYI